MDKSISVTSPKGGASPLLDGQAKLLELDHEFDELRRRSKQNREREIQAASRDRLLETLHELEQVSVEGSQEIVVMIASIESTE